MNSSLASELSARDLNIKNMGKWLDMSFLTIPVLNLAFITEFLIIWSIVLALFLVTLVALFTVGMRPCRNIIFTKYWTNLLSLKSRTLILKSPTKTNFYCHFNHHWVVDKLNSKQFSSSFCEDFNAQIFDCNGIYIQVISDFVRERFK